MLIPPYETFMVTDVKTRGDQKGLWCDTVFRKRSDLNCAVHKNAVWISDIVYENIGHEHGHVTASAKHI